MLDQIDIHECPQCHGLGVRCTGLYCARCGGHGVVGFPGGQTGSGQLMIDRETGMEITTRDLLAIAAMRADEEAPR